MIIAKLAFKELRNRPSFSLLFAASIAIGLLTFLMVDNFKRGFETSLAKTSRELMAADVKVSSRSQIPEKVRKELLAMAHDRGWQASEVHSFYSMLVGRDGSLLAEIKAVDERYPLYGGISLGEAEAKSNPEKSFHQSAEIWLSGEVAARLELHLGDSVKVGEAPFHIAGIIGEDTSVGLASISFAPEVYISLNQLRATQLIQKGSVVWESILLKLPAGEDADAVKKLVAMQLKSNTVRVQTHGDNSQNRGRMVAYVVDYLWLMSLLCFFLAATAVTFLFQNYLQSKRQEIALMLALGGSHRQAMVSYFIKIAVLGIAGAGVAFGCMLLLLPVMQSLFLALSPVKIELNLTWQTFATAFVAGVVGPLLICLPWIIQVKAIRANEVFRYVPPAAHPAKYLGWYVPAFVFFLGLAIWKARSPMSALYFYLGLFGSVLVFLASARLLHWMAGRPRWRRTFRLKHVAAYLRCHPGPTSVFMVALGLSSILVSVVPQVHKILTDQLESPDQNRADLFFFDLQEDQRDEWVDLLRKKGFRVKVAPMIRGRLKAINGNDISEPTQAESYSREAEEEQRSRNRGVNLSYETPDYATGEVVDGIPLASFKDPQTMGISIEQDYAKRMGTKLGDTLTFDIQGLPLDGKIVNLRKVNWSSFDPNFFIVVDAGSLVDAPKTFVGSVANIGDASTKIQIQKILNQRFPNVSTIDVSKILAEASRLVTKIGYILAFMSTICLLIGMMVTLVIIYHQLQNRREDFWAMTLLGGSPKTIRSLLVTQMFVLALVVGVVSSVVGIGISLIISHNMFETLRVSFLIPILNLGLIIVLSILLVLPFKLQR